MTFLFRDEFDGPVGPLTSRPGWDVKTSTRPRTRSLADWAGWQPFSLDGHGRLVVTAAKKPDDRWSSGSLSSTVSLTGPRHTEVRARCPRGVGTWSAPGWEWPFPYGSAPGIEIDLPEVLGRELGKAGLMSVAHFTAHNWRTETDEPEKGEGFDTEADLGLFHTYAALIEPYFIEFYFDGKDIFEVYASDIGVKDFTTYQTCLNITLDMGGWGGPVSCRSPQRMRVGYVRVESL